MAVDALQSIGRAALVLDLERLSESTESVESAVAAVREARLMGAGLVLRKAESLATTPRRCARTLLEADLPTLLVGNATWDPAWGDVTPLVVPVPALDSTERERLLQTYLEGSGRAVATDAAEVVAASSTLGPARLRRVAAAAVQ